MDQGKVITLSTAVAVWAARYEGQMSYSASYEGGLNTVERLFPAGSTGPGHLVGVMPKKGKIVRVRFHGTAAETSLTLRLAIRNLDGTSAGNVTPSTDIGAVFTSDNAALAGVEAVLENQALRDAKAYQAFVVNFSGPSAGDILVLVQFEPR